MRVRNGEFGYKELLQMADERIAEVHELFVRSDLPASPDREGAERLLIEIREEFY